MSIPTNRVIAFAGPYISLAAGAIAAWLMAQANMLGISGLAEDNVATDVSAALSFVLVAVLSWLGSAKWLKGHRVELEGDAIVAAAAVSASAPVAPPPDDAFAAAVLAELATAPAPPTSADDLFEEAALAGETPVALFAAPAPPPTVEADGEAFEQAVRDELLPAAALDPAPDAPIDVVIDDALPAEADDVPDGTPDALRVVMPSEAALEREPDEDDEP